MTKLEKMINFIKRNSSLKTYTFTYRGYDYYYNQYMIYRHVSNTPGLEKLEGIEKNVFDHIEGKTVNEYEGYKLVSTPDLKELKEEVYNLRGRKYSKKVIVSLDNKVTLNTDFLRIGLETIKDSLVYIAGVGRSAVMPILMSNEDHTQEFFILPVYRNDCSEFKYKLIDL